MNPISDRVSVGTLGELLVQIRLLQYGVQAAPPIKDSGNDLVAVNGETFRSVSVRTTTGERYNKPPRERLYHVLAVVQLVGYDREIRLDEARIFLLAQNEVAQASPQCAALEEHRFSGDRVAQLFGPPDRR